MWYCNAKKNIYILKMIGMGLAWSPVIPTYFIQVTTIYPLSVLFWSICL